MYAKKIFTLAFIMFYKQIKCQLSCFRRYIAHSFVLIKHYSCPFILFFIHGRVILHGIYVNISLFMVVSCSCDTTYPRVDIFSWLTFMGKNDWHGYPLFHKFHAMKQLIFFNHTWQNIYFIALQIEIKNKIFWKS